MKVNPSAWAMRSDSPEEIKKRVDAICRIVAIVVAFFSTFFLFFKILFL
ncbi:MAG: hypothetical protein ACXVAY_10625 [Mucilaginibacter sp.]